MRKYTSAIALAVACGWAVAPIGAEPVVDDPDWALLRSVQTNAPWSVHISAFDGLTYIAKRSSGDDGVHRLNPDGSLTKVVAGDRPGGLFVDPADGDVFYSEDYDGNIYRSAYPGDPREIWVSGFHSSDDDPCGIALAPADYIGPLLLPGDAVVVDRGSGSADGIWAFSLESPEDEWEIVPNSSALVDAVDIVVSNTDIYVADAGGYIWIVQTDGSVQELITSEPLSAPAGIVIDPLAGDLLVADEDDYRIVRVNPLTGEVTTLFSGFDSLRWGAVGISADGFDIVASDNIGDTVYFFTLCDLAYFPDEDCNGNGRRDLCDIAEGTSEDVNHNNLPDECECVGDLDGDDDCDQGDLGELLAAYNKDAGGDLDGDGDTDQSDLGILLYKYGTVCD